AEIKAFCGANGGSTCTSSNASTVFKWVFAQGKRVFFLPDEHLGRNTAADLSVPHDHVACYDPKKVDGGLRESDVVSAQVVVWRGFCIIHTRFTTEHVMFARKNWPDSRIIVHPECPREIVRIVDAHASTAGIIKYVEAAPAGSVVVVGTEVNLVERLAHQQAGRVTVKALAPSVCRNMSMTSDKSLHDVLVNWPDANVVSVPDRIAANARTALERMLSL
ncbi:MAG: quinolinate synthase NadA, partial [bacterium]